MAEDLKILKGVDKAGAYLSLIPQIEALISNESNLIGNLANIAAALKEQFDFFWVGFYIVEGDELILGPFQGPVACTRIGRGKGVCGASWLRKETLVVPDVEAFSGHIACSSLSKSEIVIPVFKGNEVVAVLDVDSKSLIDFDETDRLYLEQIVSLIQFG